MGTVVTGSDSVVTGSDSGPSLICIIHVSSGSPVSGGHAAGVFPSNSTRLKL